VIGDIAKEMNVSVATVSRVLNGHPDVASETRQRVLEHIQRRHYVSNRTTRVHESARTNLIGVMTPEVTGGYFSELVAGVIEALDERDVRPVIGATHGKADREVEFLKRFSRGATDGAVLILPIAAVRHLAPLHHQGYPCVVLDPAIPLDDDIPVVTSSNVTGARQATEYLIGLGHRRIGVITGHRDDEAGLEGVASRERLDGYEYALRVAGIPYDKDLIRSGAFSFDGGYDAAKGLLGLPVPPTAIFAFNDAMAAGVIRAASERKLTLPDQLSIVGFDDAETARYATPLLTSVHQPLQAMGRAAVRMLYDFLDRYAPDAPRVELSTRLVVRASTRQAPSIGP